ncbi:hypothetical protein SAMN05192549_113111 [Duganella sacchari]|uniref:Uncharacterized protein n=1 Tax=Duganella sacchari TaxID=551987 RepID=A0A1M7R7A2_9BURK|nr:hypothetical protein [Duganella sacchari]SHN42009.1 hypothetical protein SAMN05192549_113111 [Duganella sacchari]
MKQLHLTGKLACAVVALAAVISGCQKKAVDNPPVPEATPAPAAAPATPPTTTPEGMTPANPNAPAADAPTQTPPPATTEPPPPATR